ncbi:60S ribosomal protein L13-1-like protein [Tanacetum coccineum]
MKRTAELLVLPISGLRIFVADSFICSENALSKVYHRRDMPDSFISFQIEEVSDAFVAILYHIIRECQTPRLAHPSKQFGLRKTYIDTSKLFEKIFIQASIRARQAKAVKVFPRPAGRLRPQVHGQTLKYNMKLREGRGFSLEELKAAGIPKKLAPTIGIAVDHRRRNRSLEGLQANVQRLKTFKAKLVIFPRRARKTKTALLVLAQEMKVCCYDWRKDEKELATATQVQGPVLPILREKPTTELVKVTEEMKSFNAFAKIRLERTNKRHQGARLKRAAEADKEEKK